MKKLTLRPGRGSYGIFREGERVASVSTKIMDQEEVGNMMAAGPELWEVLGDCLDSLEWIERTLPGTMGNGVRQERIIRARAILSKAKGGVANA
jgi:hypothetical protein